MKKIPRKNESTFGQYFLSDVIDWVKTFLKPEQVFEEDDLQKWAISNGYIDVTLLPKNYLKKHDD